MGLRFRRSIKIFPGVRLNISPSGVSTSIGGPGARATVSHGQVRETVGIPGSGISYSHVDGAHHPKTTLEGPGPAQSRGMLALKLIAFDVLVAWLASLVMNHGGLPL